MTVDFEKIAAEGEKIVSCLDCHYCGPDPEFHASGPTSSCWHPDIVKKEIVNRYHEGLPPRAKYDVMYCSMARDTKEFSKCGPDAVLFKPKDPGDPSGVPLELRKKFAESHKSVSGPSSLERFFFVCVGAVLALAAITAAYIAEIIAKPF